MLNTKQSMVEENKIIGLLRSGTTFSRNIQHPNVKKNTGISVDYTDINHTILPLFRSGHKK